MPRRTTFFAHALAVFTFAATTAAAVELLNVSYDPTRELWRAINERVRRQVQGEDRHRRHHQAVARRLGHAGPRRHRRPRGRRRHARARGPTPNAIAQGGPDRRRTGTTRLPNHSLPYTSTIVFVVRKGNPKGIKDWPDLVKPGVEIVTPNPKTSGNGKLSFLAAWGSVIAARRLRGRRARVRHEALRADAGARLGRARLDRRPSSQKKIGDVHLTWENEAHLEVQEAKRRARDRLPADQHPRRAARRGGRRQRRAQGHARGGRGVPRVPLHATRARRSSPSTSTGRRTRRCSRSTRATSPTSSSSRSPRSPRAGTTRTTKFFADGGVFDSIYKPK